MSAGKGGRTLGLSFLLSRFIHGNRTVDATQEFLEVTAFEQSIAIRRIPVHRDVATSGPFTERIVVNAEVISSFCGVHVFGQFGHGLGLCSLVANLARPVA